MGNRIDDNLVHSHTNEELVRAFCEYEVDFLVIGGLAVAWYCESRTADDMDLLVNPEPENAVRVVSALNSIKIPAKRESIAGPGKRLTVKKVHYADILTPLPGGPSYAELRQESVEGRLFHIPVRIPSRMGLVALKRQSVQSAEEELSKHRSDLELLLGKCDV